MVRLRRACENVLHQQYDALRKEFHVGNIPPDVNEDFLVIADRYIGLHIVVINRYYVEL